MTFLDDAAVKTIHPLVHLESAGVVGTSEFLPARPGQSGPHHVYVVICRDCGNVTRQESGYTVNDAPSEQAHMYARRHLSRHLKELADEIIKFNR